MPLLSVKRPFLHSKKHITLNFESKLTEATYMSCLSPVKAILAVMDREQKPYGQPINTAISFWPFKGLLVIRQMGRFFNPCGPVFFFFL